MFLNVQKYKTANLNTFTSTHLNMKHRDSQTNFRRYADGLRALQEQNK